MIRDLIKKEAARQKKYIDLIPSENYASTSVMAAVGSPLMNKYAEGYPHKRYYQGNAVVDAIEDEVRRLALKAFKLSPKVWAVNVQPHSGSPANLAAYLGTIPMGEKILAMSLAHGGHLTHGHAVSITSKLWQFKQYGVDDDGYLDYDEIERMAREFQPKLIVCGATAYSRHFDFKRFRAIADAVGAKLMADMSHVAGLIVGGAHPSPFPYADIVTFTTHKTLRGPRGAVIIARAGFIEGINKALFPGLQGGPHLHSIAGIGVALEEALKPSFRTYAKQIVQNAKTLAGELTRLGFTIVSGGTDNHLMLVDLRPQGISGSDAAVLLEQHGIVCNKNSIPNDPGKPWNPSGIRLGTPAATTRGMKEKDMIKLARKIHQVLNDH